MVGDARVALRGVSDSYGHQLFEFGRELSVVVDGAFELNKLPEQFRLQFSHLVIDLVLSPFRNVVH
jgi:hypothetical protein